MHLNMAVCSTVILCVFMALVSEVHLQVQDYQRFPMQIERIGHAVDLADDQLPSGLNYTNTTFLLNDVIMQDGVLFAYSAYFLSDRPIRFQVWRPVDIFRRKFKLLWEHRIVPKEWNKRIETYISELPNSTCQPVNDGDRLGVFIEEAPSSVSHVFNGRKPETFTHPLKRTESFANVDDVVTFDALAFPYEYNVAAYVDVNLNRYQGGVFSCPPDKPLLRPVPTQTPEPPKTKTPETLTVKPHPIGPPGPPGPIGPPGQGSHPNVVVHPAIVNNAGATGGGCGCGHETSLFNPTTLLVLVGWLTALTIINLCYICIMCCRCTTRTTYHSERQNTRNTLVENLRGGLGGLGAGYGGGLAEVTHKNDEIAFTKIEQEMTPSPLINKSFDFED